MSQAGYTPISLYYSTTVAATPSAANLANGELAINITDGKLYYKDNSGVVQLIASKAGASGSVTSVAQSFTGGLISVSGSPITTSGTLALTVAGTSGGVPYFSSASTWASSAALAANAIVLGGGAGAAPATTTTGTGVVTALGVNTGTAGAFVVNGGALGTPSSGTVTNLTGTASININGTVGATTPTTGAFTTISASGVASFADGTVSAPGITFTSDTDTGLYRIGANNIGVGVNGAKVLDIGTTGLKVTIPTSGVTGVQIGTGSTTQMGWLVGNLNNGAAAMWVTSVTPSASNYTVYADGVGVGSSYIIQSYHKATSDGTLYNVANYHESRQSAANWTHIISNKNASSPYGIEILYTAAAPNGTDNYFLLCADSGANRAYIPSNGGLYNYQANNSNLSDERLKKDWANAPSYYERWKQIEFKTFLYKDQTDTELNLGVSAQQLESVCPELVNKNGWGKEIPEDGVPLKSVYQTDFQFATAKALQELMLKFEELKAEFDAYKAAHP